MLENEAVVQHMEVELVLDDLKEKVKELDKAAAFLLVLLRHSTLLLPEIFTEREPY